MIHLQEESCLRICSLLADGIVVNPGAVLPDFSVNSIMFSLKGLDITVPLDVEIPNHSSSNGNSAFCSCFTRARLHIEDLLFSDSPSLKLRLLNLEKDPACFCLWDNQPVDASQKKWMTKASLLTLSLDPFSEPSGLQISKPPSGLWRCVELKDACIEVAMVTANGSPLINVPPPGGVVRIGVVCQQYLSNTSVEQLFFVLDLYAYFGGVSEKIAVIGKNSRLRNMRHVSRGESFLEKAPSDTAVSLAVKDLQLRFIESSSTDFQGLPLVQFLGEDLFVKVTHRTLGGAMAVSSVLRWDGIQVDSADTGENFEYKNGTTSSSEENGDLVTVNGHPQLRAVFWVQKSRNLLTNGKTLTVPCLEISMVHVIPYNTSDLECHSLSLSACIAGVRLGGGMNYAEALLHRFGILGPDGGRGEGLSNGLERFSRSPLSKLFKTSPMIANELEESVKNDASGDATDSGLLHLATPDDVDVSIEFKDWLFALEGAGADTQRLFLQNYEDSGREEQCWLTTFQSLLVKANGSPKHVVNGKEKSLQPKRYPIELITVGVEGLQILKPQARKLIFEGGLPPSGLKGTVETLGGISLEVRVVISGEDINDRMPKWVVENLKFSVGQPIEAVVTKDELQHLALLCKSEVDSMGRIAAGVLRILKLEGSFGQAAITQLSNLGTESFDKIFTPERLSRDCSPVSIRLSPSSNANGEILHPTLESTVASLEEALTDSQARCAALKAELCMAETCIQHLADIKQLSDKLESMQNLLMRLRTQI